MGISTPHCFHQGIQVSSHVVYSVHIIDHFFSGEAGVLLPPNSYARQYIQFKPRKEDKLLYFHNYFVSKLSVKFYQLFLSCKTQPYRPTKEKIY